jgi:hypothetical protein
MDKFNRGDVIEVKFSRNDEYHRVVNRHEGRIVSYTRTNKMTGNITNEYCDETDVIFVKSPDKDIAKYVMERIEQLSKVVPIPDFRNGKLSAYTEVLNELGYERVLVPQPPVYEFRKIG